MTTEKDFKNWQEDNYNFITPVIDKLLTVETTDGVQVVIEISKERETLEDPNYGVTILNATEEDGEFENCNHELAQYFTGDDARKEARKYASNLSQFVNRHDIVTLQHKDEIRVNER